MQSEELHNKEIITWIIFLLTQIKQKKQQQKHTLRGNGDELLDCISQFMALVA